VAIGEYVINVVVDFPLINLNNTFAFKIEIEITTLSDRS
jgi:hypothetical protein